MRSEANRVASAFVVSTTDSDRSGHGELTVCTTQVEVSSIWSEAATENRMPTLSSMNFQSHRMQAPPAEAAGGSTTLTGGTGGLDSAGLLQPGTASNTAAPSTAKRVR